MYIVLPVQQVSRPSVLVKQRDNPSYEGEGKWSGDENLQSPEGCREEGAKNQHRSMHETHTQQNLKLSTPAHTSASSPKASKSKTPSTPPSSPPASQTQSPQTSLPPPAPAPSVLPHRPQPPHQSSPQTHPSSRSDSTRTYALRMQPRPHVQR